VGLPTNFKAARFDAEEPTALLRNLEADIEEARFHLGDGAIEIPVKLDRLVRRIARQQGFQSDTLHEIVTLVDERLGRNRLAC